MSMYPFGVAVALPFVIVLSWVRIMTTILPDF